MLIGVGLMAAGRLIVGPKGRELLGSLQQRIADFDGYREEEEPDDEIGGEGDEDFEEGTTRMTPKEEATRTSTMRTTRAIPRDKAMKSSTMRSTRAETESTTRMVLLACVGGPARGSAAAPRRKTGPN